MAGTARVNLKQTAINQAGNLAAAAMQAGQFETYDEGIEAILFGADKLYDSLDQQFEEASATAATSSAGSEQTAAKVENPGDTEFTWGKKAGQTIAQVQETDPDYINWLVNKDKNPGRNFMRKLASQFLESAKAGV